MLRGMASPSPELRDALVRMAALGLAAVALAALANALAGPERRLPWRGFPAVRGAEAPLPSVPPSAPPVPAMSPPPGRRAADPLPGIPAADAEGLAARFPLDPAHPIGEVDEAQALEAFRLGALFVDARRSAEYRAGHIPGAVSLPLWEDGLEGRLADLRDFRIEDPRRVIIVYCSGQGCPDSRDLAQRLFALGLPNLRLYEGGFPGWAAQGRPVAKGGP